MSEVSRDREVDDLPFFFFFLTVRAVYCLSIDVQFDFCLPPVHTICLVLCFVSHTRRSQVPGIQWTLSTVQRSWGVD